MSTLTVKVSVEGGEKMGTHERRYAIMRLLCRRRHETIRNLAKEFGVSERTIQRDIEVLSISEPIYTQLGKYKGGVYVVDDYYWDRMYMSNEEICLLNKLYCLVTDGVLILTNSEADILNRIISQYSKPMIKNERIRV